MTKVTIPAGEYDADEVAAIISDLGRQAIEDNRERNEEDARAMVEAPPDASTYSPFADEQQPADAVEAYALDTAQRLISDEVKPLRRLLDGWADAGSTERGRLLEALSGPQVKPFVNRFRKLTADRQAEALATVRRVLDGDPTE